MTQFIIAGATGLIGKAICRQLKDSSNKVTLLSRRPIKAQHPHHIIQQTDFTDLTLPLAESPTDTVLCALGTTIKKAGSPAAFIAVDLDLVLTVAKAAKASGFQKFIVVSSLGTRDGTKNFYLQTKAKMENALRELGFDSLVILRPSLLLGERDEFRIGEKVAEIAAVLMTPFWKGKLARYQPIHAEQVAKAMVNLAKTKTDNVAIVESERIRRLAI